MQEQEKENKKKKKYNPRTKNGNARKKLRERIKMQGRDCAICGRPIDYTLPAGHPWSYELDEIIPVSLGGNPLDIKNVQPTHRTCNQAKGNKLMKNSINIPKTNKKVNIGQIKTSKEW